MFLRSDGGSPVFPDDGTLSMWTTASIAANPGDFPIFYRPATNVPPVLLPTVSAGPLLTTYAGQFGLLDEPPGGGPVLLHAFPTSAVQPYLRRGEFNQFVTAWRRGATDAGPTVYLVINGGLGERFDDAGADAGDPYRDAQPNEAGSLPVPYQGYSSTRWDDSDASARALRFGSPAPNSMLQGTIDDVAVWDRVLSFSEIEDMYKAGVSIGQACHLP
jgi:hypothetical protein